MAKKRAAYRYQGRRFTVTPIGACFMVQEFYACDDSPTGYYAEGAAGFLSRETEAVSPEQAIVVFVGAAKS